jgi:hypothetical protein
VIVSLNGSGVKWKYVAKMSVGSGKGQGTLMGMVTWQSPRASGIRGTESLTYYTTVIYQMGNVSAILVITGLAVIPDIFGWVLT